uniref:Uncharacterized protein n=1 Tax=Anguilla anguilla TaxID=7936 RepID=A0A0E9S1Z2_ANGAN
MISMQPRLSFLPLPWNCEVVSQPVNEWNASRAKLIFLPSFLKIVLMHIY